MVHYTPHIWIPPCPFPCRNPPLRAGAGAQAALLIAGDSVQHMGGSSLSRRCSASPHPSYFGGDPIIGMRALWKGEKQSSAAQTESRAPVFALTGKGMGTAAVLTRGALKNQIPLKLSPFNRISVHRQLQVCHGRSKREGRGKRPGWSQQPHAQAGAALGSAAGAPSPRGPTMKPSPRGYRGGGSTKEMLGSAQRH